MSSSNATAILPTTSTSNAVTLGRNLLAGLANSIWSAVIGFAVVPFYLKYLGIEAYGLIGFFMTLQVMFQLLDMGLASTMNREVARCKAAGCTADAARLLHTLAVIYWAIAGVIVVLIALTATTISSIWLRSSQVPPDTIMTSLYLMGVAIAARWPVGLYQGVLLGAQRQTIASGINMVMIAAGSGGAILILEFVAPTLEAFFSWHALIGLIYALTARYAAWNQLGDRIARHFSMQELKRVWDFSIRVTGIAATGVLFSQLDKLILSSTLALGEFGQYVIASTLVGSIYLVVTPIFNALYPKFSGLVASEQEANLWSLYRVSVRAVGSIVFPAAMFFALQGKVVIDMWVGIDNIDAGSVAAVGYLALGIAIHGVMHMPYALQLAYGKAGMVLRNNLILLLLTAPIIILGSTKYGVLGAGVSWLVLHIISCFWINFQIQKNLRPHAFRNFAIDLCIPLALSALFAIAAYWVAGDMHANYKLVSCFLIMASGSMLLLYGCVVRSDLLCRLQKSQPSN